MKNERTDKEEDRPTCSNPNCNLLVRFDWRPYDGLCEDGKLYCMSCIGDNNCGCSEVNNDQK